MLGVSDVDVDRRSPVGGLDSRRSRFTLRRILRLCLAVSSRGWPWQSSSSSGVGARWFGFHCVVIAVRVTVSDAAFTSVGLGGARTPLRRNVLPRQPSAD